MPKSIEEKASEVLKRIKDPTTKLLCYDAETSGLDWRRNYIVGHVFNFGPREEDSYYIPVRHQGSANLGGFPALKDQYTGVLINPFEQELNEAIRDKPYLHLFGHNFIFDLMFLNKHGIKITQTVEDTQVNQALLNEFQGSYTLSACCSAMKVAEKKGDLLYQHMAALFGGEADRNQMSNFWRLTGDDALAVEYAVGDGISTWQLREAQVEAIEGNDLTNIWQLEKRVTRTLYRMRVKGVKIDEHALHKVEQFARTEGDKAKSKLPRDFNPRSSTQMKQYLFSNGVREEDVPRTAPSAKFPNGQLSFGKNWLATIPAGQVIIKAREFDHLINSFVTPLREKHIHEGHVHAEYYQLIGDNFGTITGRLSCSSPNLQQVPKRNKEVGKPFRSVFVPDDGHKWFSADFSQCEPRLLAHYGQVKVLIDGYTADPPIDAHTSVARAAGIDRESGKRLNQTLITGGGLGAVSETLAAIGKSYSETLEIWNNYFEAMPEIKVLQKESAYRMRRRGYVISLLGRRARLEVVRNKFGGYEDKSYKALNRLLQCGNADVIKKAMTDIDDYFESNGDTCRILNNVHDALDFSGPEHERDGQIKEALRLMSDFGPGRSVELTVPLAVDVGAGVSWSDATWGDDKWTVS